ncbi:CBS domain-containing protein [uncultured Halovibrio sp.]|uniref:CBS domain-containing protein n=1 Tax=uncultured Halovibrio sp. TaxID=985049 RepID=UPI0025E9E0B4|nr:CBS domain-containing protein [uncultured Halovibrio sp.]
MPVQTLIEHLKAHGAEYQCLSHPPGFTAQSLAHHCNVPGDQVAKTVIIELDGRMAMLVMPASFRIRWDRMMEVLYTDFVELAARERDPATVTVDDCMSAPVVTVSSTTTLGEAAELMRDENVKKLPVTGADGDGVVGLVTTTDIAKYLPVHEFHPEER